MHFILPFAFFISKVHTEDKHSMKSLKIIEIGLLIKFYFNLKLK